MWRQVVIASVVVALASCASPARKDQGAASEVAVPADMAMRRAATPAQAIADPSAVAEAATVVGDDADSGVPLPPELADRRVIYFAFDSDELKGNNLETIAAHARFLAGNGAVQVRLEGHTDPRGTPEYNIGLGERRAQAVRRALALQGVPDSRIATVSLGEERLAASGDDERSLSLNRRVEFFYTLQ